jgi:hypothetical protein
MHLQASTVPRSLALLVDVIPPHALYQSHQLPLDLIGVLAPQRRRSELMSGWRDNSTMFALLS